jgi:hypothetical protein
MGIPDRALGALPTTFSCSKRYSSLLRPTSLTAHAGNGRRKTTIASRPVELLVVILRDVYEQCKASGVDPIALSSVYSFWRNVGPNGKGQAKVV